jgi:hypothetical protein
MTNTKQTRDERQTTTATRERNGTSLGELREALRRGQTTGNQSLARVGSDDPDPSGTSGTPVVVRAVRVPRGTFHVSISDLKRQLRTGTVRVGPNGLEDANSPSSQQQPQRPPQSTPGAAVRVPKGTFHGSVLDRLRRLVGEPAGHIEEFVAAAPYAEFVGEIDGELVWTEWVTDPVTGAQVQLAYSTDDDGETAEAYCIDPNMEGHGEDVHDCHCYPDGRLCTDQHNVVRTLVEKRARAILWVTGFCQYLKTGNFKLDEA